MNRLSFSLVAGLLLVPGYFGTALAEEVKAGDLVIDHAWSRATPAGAKVGAGYLTIANKGTAPDRLVGGATPVARAIEVHEMSMKDGVMTMRPLRDGLTIEPGQTVTLAPGGFHIMFMDLKSPLKKGGQLHASLEFEKAGKVDLTFQIESVGAKAPMDMPHDHNMDMSHDHKM